MKLEQSITFKDYCLMCGKDTKDETCSSVCRGKLRIVRNTISNQREIEKAQYGTNGDWTPRRIKAFKYMQDLIGFDKIDNSNTNDSK